MALVYPRKTAVSGKGRKMAYKILITDDNTQLLKMLKNILK